MEWRLLYVHCHEIHVGMSGMRPCGAVVSVGIPVLGALAFGTMRSLWPTLARLIVWLHAMKIGAANGLEPVHDLLSSSARNARWMDCKLVLSLRSQFFHSLRFFSSQAKLRSTLQRLGMTLK
ncbi:hypothetical protein DXO129_08525, partial [Xanthomonas oryzae pv. oryzae]